MVWSSGSPKVAANVEDEESEREDSDFWGSEIFLMTCIEIGNWPNQASHVGITFYLILTKLTSYAFIRW
jgi:hypothetical protein